MTTTCRLSRNYFRHVLSERSLESNTWRDTVLTAELKVIIILCYLAAGKMQQCSCDDLDVPQPIVRKYIIDTVNALSR